MAIIKWRESYNTGIPQIDKEHEKIIELVNSMFIVIRDKAGKEMVLNTLEQTLSYTEYHFENEEKMMQDAGYPDFEEHMKEHHKLKTDAEQFKLRLEENFADGSKEFYRFLREWVMDHILECDMKYAKTLKQNIGTTE